MKYRQAVDSDNDYCLGRAVAYIYVWPKRRQAAKMAACRWHNFYSRVALEALLCRVPRVSDLITDLVRLVINHQFELLSILIL